MNTACGIILMTFLSVNTSLFAQNSQDDCNKLVSCKAGALLYTFIEEESYILLAAHKECRQRGWAGFGGGCKENETALSAALRETSEETGSVYSVEYLEERLDNGKTYKSNNFVTYLLEVEWHSTSVLDSASEKNKNDERGPFKWVKWSDLLSLVDSKEIEQIFEDKTFPATDYQYLWDEFATGLNENREFIHAVLERKDKSQPKKLESFTHQPKSKSIIVDSIDLFGAGGLKSAVNGDESNSATGSLGINFSAVRQHDQHSKLKYNVFVSYNLNESDTIDIRDNKGLGSNLLVPDLNGKSVSIRVNAEPKDGVSRVMGWYLFADLADATWNLSWQVNDLDSQRFVQVNPISIKAGLSYYPFKFDLNESNKNNINFWISAGLTSRIIAGDVAGDKEFEALSNFGVKRKFWPGLEGSINLTINKAQVFADLVWLPELKNDIDGLTGFRVVIGAILRAKAINL